MTERDSDSGDPLHFVDEWFARLPEWQWETNILLPAGRAEAVALFAVDTINAFAHEGMLAGERMRRMLERLRRLFIRAHEWGVPHFILLLDSHNDDAEEFRYFPAHAVRGTTEARLASEIESLPFRDRFTVFVKNSFHPANATSLEPWLMDNPQVTHFVVTGCGTDLGVYLLATYLHTHLLAHNAPGRVIVPAECTDTYHMDASFAAGRGSLPHPADLFHKIALYHLAIHGITVVKDIR
ncbi:MAG: isochorismatase family protein [Chthonomonadetes bacterium]|nr:isochorismatase family protein [Chthonomonadetes bacterium]